MEKLRTLVRRHNCFCRLGGAGLLAGLLTGALCRQPVWRTLGMGQINIVLLAMVAVDVLALRGKRRCGVATTKLGARDRGQAVILVYEAGLVAPRSEAPEAE